MEKYSAAHFLDEQAQMERLPEAPTENKNTAGGCVYVSFNKTQTASSRRFYSCCSCLLRSCVSLIT